MKELSNLPYSVRQQLESTTPEHGGQSFAKQAATELARSKPELCALAIAANYGYTQLSLREVETKHSCEITPVKVLGMEIGKRIQPVTTMTITERTWRLS